MSTAGKGSGLWRGIKRDWILYLLLLIPVLHTFLFKYVPMAGIVIAFKDFNPMEGIFGSPWAGVK